MGSWRVLFVPSDALVRSNVGMPSGSVIQTGLTSPEITIRADYLQVCGGSRTGWAGFVHWGSTRNEAPRST
jgi:hypothetical protein